MVRPKAVESIQFAFVAAVATQLAPADVVPECARLAAAAAPSHDTPELSLQTNKQTNSYATRRQAARVSPACCDTRRQVVVVGRRRLCRSHLSAACALVSGARRRLWRVLFARVAHVRNSSGGGSGSNPDKMSRRRRRVDTRRARDRLQLLRAPRGAYNWLSAAPGKRRPRRRQ